MNVSASLRPSPIAGQWYPGNASQLARSVDDYIARAKLPMIDAEIIAVMAPHAGHIYSGPIAGYAFAALKGKEFEVVAVVSPMHHPYSYPLLTTVHSAYNTPLGEIPVDRDSIDALDRALKSTLNFGLTPVARDPEHSLEIELPFLQRALAGDFRLLPVMVRDQDVKLMEILGGALAKVLKGKNMLMVASTDLSHFYPQELANKLDAELLRRVEAFDPAGVIRAEDEGVGYACGRGALASVMWAARDLGANKIMVLSHATSGDITGDFSQVVGYGAAVMIRT
jgi:AmmeMemoRadiSam system protein B